MDQEELTNTIQSTVKLLDDDRTKALHFQEGMQALTAKTQGAFFTAFGPNASSAGELHLSYCSVLQIIEKKQAFKKVFQKDLSQRDESGDRPDLSLSAGQIVRYLTGDNTRELRQAVRACFHHISGSAGSLEMVKYSFIELIIEVTQKLKSSALTDSGISALKQHAFSLISSADSFSALEENMLACFTALAEQLGESGSPEYSFLVRSAVNYVRENYRDCNLSLKTLAGQMNVNATYLGRQFSLETKEYFSDYLNRIRVTQATQLLNDTMWKTSRIAEEVGFANASYFYTIFKKVTGKSPGILSSSINPVSIAKN